MQEEANNEKQAIGREELMKGEEVKEDEIKGMEEDKVLLQVNGKLFSTSRSKILRQSGTFFEAMLGSGLWEPNESGIYVIERDDTYFHLILDYLENGNASVFKELTIEEWEMLNIELDYYQIKVLTWDVKRCSFDIATFSNNNFRVNIHSRLGCAIGKFPVYNFSVCIENYQFLDVGFLADETKFNEKRTDMTDYRHFFPKYLLYFNGRLYGKDKNQSMDWNHKSAQFKNGDILTFSIEKSTIQIHKNGEYLGVAWTDVKGPLFPLAVGYSGSPSCTFVSEENIEYNNFD